MSSYGSVKTSLLALNPISLGRPWSRITITTGMILDFLERLQ